MTENERRGKRNGETRVIRGIRTHRSRASYLDDPMRYAKDVGYSSMEKPSPCVGDESFELDAFETRWPRRRRGEIPQRPSDRVNLAAGRDAVGEEPGPRDENGVAYWSQRSAAENETQNICKSRQNRVTASQTARLTGKLENAASVPRGVGDSSDTIEECTRRVRRGLHEAPARWLVDDDHGSGNAVGHVRLGGYRTGAVPVELTDGTSCSARWRRVMASAWATWRSGKESRLGWSRATADMRASLTQRKKNISASCQP